MAVRHEPNPQEISFSEARSIIGLTRRDFREYSEPYVEKGQTALAPLSVVRIADSAYRAGVSQVFFPSLERVAGRVIGHVVEHAPEAVPEICEEIVDYVAAATAHTAPVALGPTPPVAGDTIERLYLGISNDLGH